MIKAIFFDLDGVLVDMCDSHYEALNRAINEICGYEIDRNLHIKYYNGISTEKKLNMLINRGIVSPSQYQKIWDKKQEYTFEIIDNLQEDKEKIRMMELLKADGFILACVSNSIVRSTFKMLKQIGVLPFLDFYLGNENFGERIKPDPYPYQLAFKKVNELVNKHNVVIEPKNCVIVEDSPKGIMSAERSGANVLEVKNATYVAYENVIKFIERIKD